ncbi:MAG: type II/IV secretion system protein [Burkholderiales bacterium]|nr:MAG: type II/IV secretion system protein [Burkholderiales bacterium]
MKRVLSDPAAPAQTGASTVAESAAERRASPRTDVASRGVGARGRRLGVEDVLAALHEDGLIDAEQLQTQVGYARLTQARRHALVAVAERRLRSVAAPHRELDLEALTAWLAGRCGLEHAHIDPLKVDFAKVADVMSSSYATRFDVLPLEVRTGEVVIATCEPMLDEWVDELSALLRKRIVRVIASPVDIARYIVEFYSLARSVRGASKGVGNGHTSSFEQLVELGRSGRNLDANDQHVVTIVDWLWQYAFDQRASDIHLEPRRELGVVRFRIDGVLHNVYQVPPAVLSAMTSRIKLLGRMDVVEKRRPQDGRIKTRTAEGREIELRLATLPTVFGEKMVMRIFDPEVLVKGFSDLGFSDEDLSRWDEMTRRPNGIILVTGPTGSGKTTTLYSTLRQLANEEVNVCTVEDPIEMVEPAFNQMQVNNGIDLGFADGIRALMRQDPDIIMIGEIRDLQTAEMAIQAALTGHLVLSTLHTNDSASAVTRMLDLGVAPFLLNATLIGVMAQRLVRTLCPHCKAPHDALPEDAWEGMIRPFRARRPSTAWRAVGCLECRNTGYRGRAGLYEILTMTDGIRALVDERPDLVRIRQKAMRDGMKPLRLAGAMKVAAGQTTIEEVLRNAPPAH